MTSAEFDTLVAEKLGVRRHVVRRDLAVLAGGLRPGERVLTLGLADRGLLLGGGRVVAATDQRLLMASASSGCRELAYDALAALTDDAAAARSPAAGSTRRSSSCSGVETCRGAPGRLRRSLRRSRSPGRAPRALAVVHRREGSSGRAVMRVRLTAAAPGQRMAACSSRL
jgi:hypothetical protein